ncbi:putative CCR4-associated factor 1 like 7 [Dendrobium catenatum]|uniref:poly(A)-specific ribonuclease n=1 Tax=Dendrobium catenatum TaxID=906689 RepID=A0A2I0V8U9_9ASPA|nr:putative CCR4-associated factor 1 like 7 [Dendrobium catenatum]
MKEELSLIRSIIANYPFISMDIEFPTVLVPFAITSPTSFVFNYQNLKCNVDIVKLIQLGLTLFDSSGHLPLFGSPPRPFI